MDIETAKRIYTRFDNSAYLDRRDQLLFDEASDVLLENDLMDENGNLIETE